ncbi:MAG: hypothetical protein ACYSX0_06840 [Planctomycetota bacterium]|jgi:cell division protein FtsL
MRDLRLWAAAAVFLLTALYTVHVRRELYQLGSQLGELESRVVEQGCRNDNLQIDVLRLRSPGRLLERANEAGVEFVWEEAANR